MLIWEVSGDTCLTTDYKNAALSYGDSAVFYYVVIPLTHHKNSGYKVLGVWRSIILLFTAFLVGVLKG